MLSAALAIPGVGMAAVSGSNSGGAVITLAPKAASGAKNLTLTIDGTGSTQTFTLNAKNVTSDVTLKATSGFEVFPESIPATEADGATVTVTLKSTLPTTYGQVILRSDDARSYIDLVGIGSALTVKDLSKNPVFSSIEDDGSGSKAKTDGFTPGDNGYTIEFRAKTATAAAGFSAYAVTEDGYGLKAFVTGNEVGLYNGPTDKKSFKNPVTNVDGGKGSFYNNDGKYHTYRYAVTSDKRAFIYRDGILVNTVRLADYGLQPEWGVENDDVRENLLRNGDFEGEMTDTASTIRSIEAWQLGPFDQYNCTFKRVNEEINNEYDPDNHILRLTRYNWNDGWAAGTASQIVNVAPGETYSLTCLARGGMKMKDDAVYEKMGYIKIQEVQNSDLGTSAELENPDDWKEVALNYTTSAECKQLKVVIYQERFLNGGGWGSSMQPLDVDNMVLTGMARTTDQKVGFSNDFAAVEYFTYDVSGAYAPPVVALSPAEESVEIKGTGNTKTIKIHTEGLTEPVSVKVSGGFSVFPEELEPDGDGEITVTLNSSLKQTDGKVTLRSGDVRSYITLKGIGSELEEKDLSANPVFANPEDDASDSKAKADGFTPGENGYTIEFRAKTATAAAGFNAYAVTEDGYGIKAYVTGNEVGLYNGPTDKKSFKNPATNVDGGKGTFYNNDGKYHTYRYAVTPDKRAFIYRDGLPIDTVRLADYGLQPEWGVENDDIVENLLRNPDFEGEFGAKISGTVRSIEGWILNPFDQYNCTFAVANEEISNEQDPDNHILELKRYNWNDGWAAGTASQIVNVAPGETYSLTCLARGGMKMKDDAVYEKMGYIKIQEVQNSDLGTSAELENPDDWKEVALNYTTSAECKQLKISVYQERFLNGGGWGSSMKPLDVDNMVLTGMARTTDQKVGFSNDFAAVEYFTYDVTGAYAPKLTVLGDVDAIEAGKSYGWDTAAGGLTLHGVSEPVDVKVYNSVGMLVYAGTYSQGQVIDLNGKGLYICEIDDNGQKSVLKVMNN